MKSLNLKFSYFYFFQNENYNSILPDIDNILPDLDDNFTQKPSQKSKYSSQITKKNNLTHKTSSQILEISDDDDNLFPNLDDNLIHKYSQKSKDLDETTIIDGNLLVSKTSRLVTTLIVLCFYVGTFL